jgi:signal transduction histidine kinase
VSRRLLLSYLGVTMLVLVALEVPLGIQNARSVRRDLESRLARDAWVLSADAEDAVQSRRVTDLRPVARVAYDYAHETGGRVVIVDPDGNALIDTSARVTGRESFASRPEFRAALRGDVATGTRQSATLHARLLYVAVPVASGGVVHGAVRVTYPMSAADARVLRYWLMLAAIAGIVLATAALVGVRLARFVIRPLRDLERAAAAVGAGDLEARASERGGPPEVRSLAHVLNATVEKLARLLRSQDEFVADASHELRTPLTALRLRLENLGHNLRETQAADVAASIAEVDRLSSMVEGLLALARADAADVVPGPLDACDVVRGRLDSWQALAEPCGVDVTAATNGPVIATARRDRLGQVLDNLVANAIAHSPRGTNVTVTVDGTPDGVELHVRDHGRGMSETERERAFGRFWRAGSGPGGSGLGLAIVRKLVEADGGTVALESEPGSGTDAVVRLRRA